jgi:hypothetical protein
MKQTRSTEAHIVSILHEADVDEVKRLRELEAENAHLKRLLAESHLEIDAIREVLRGK